MKHQSFEDYLGDIHAEDYMGTDDNMSDAFDTWVSNLDAQELIDHAENYGHKVYFEGYELGSNGMLPHIKMLEDMIGSKSSDYNKGVQDCINLLQKQP